MKTSEVFNRMQALRHLQATLSDPRGHAEAVREFLKAPHTLTTDTTPPKEGEVQGVNTFEREQRYLVFKRADLQKHLGPSDMDSLQKIVLAVEDGRKLEGKDPLECVVIESDWPEYEPTWRAIEQRVNGNPAPTQSEAAGQVAWRTFDGEGGYEYRDFEGNENYAEEWVRRNPYHKGWVEPLYTHEAPAQAEAVEPVAWRDLVIAAVDPDSGYIEHFLGSWNSERTRCTACGATDSDGWVDGESIQHNPGCKWQAKQDAVQKLRAILSPTPAAQPAQAEAVEPVAFEREQRYIVLKVKDIEAAHFDGKTLAALNYITTEIDANRKGDGKQPLQCVVVESDWPEYEPTWRAIEQRVSGASAPAQVVPDDIEGRLTSVFTEMLSGAWFCNRVWHAWSVGAMSEDDFSLVSESDLPKELAQQAVDLLRTPAHPQPAQAEAQDSIDLERKDYCNYAIMAG